MNQGVYKKSSNPIAEPVPTRDGIRLEALTDMLPLIQVTQNSPLDLETRSRIYDIGP